MSAMLKQKLIDIANGFTKYGLWKGGSEITVDSELSTTSTNPVQNKVVTENINTLKRNFNNYEIKILTSTETTSNVGTFSFNYTNELPNGGILLLFYTANSNYWCRLYGFSDGNCVLGIADYNMQNSANTQHTVYSYWLVKKVNRLFDSITGKSFLNIVENF